MKPSMKISRHLGSALLLSTLTTSWSVATAQSVTTDDAATGAQHLKKISVVGEEEAESYNARAANTATGLDLSLRETPQSITVITRERMDDQAINDISSVLDQSVGVNVNATSAAGSDGVSFYARGFEIKNFQIDGIPRPPSIYGFSETTTDTAQYERIEIVRGATGLMSGPGNPSAAVNLVRKRPTAEAHVFIEGELGSFDHNRVVADMSGGLNESSSLRGRIVSTYETDDAYVDRATTDKKLIYGILEFDLTHSTLLTAGFEYQDLSSDGASRGGVPLFFLDGSQAHLPRHSNTGAQWNELSRTTTRYFASLAQYFDNGWSLRLDAEESRPDYDEAFSYMYGPFDAETGQGSSIGTARWAGDLKQRIVSLSAAGSFEWLGREHELGFGASYNTAQDGGNDYPGWWSGPDYWAALPDAWQFLGDGRFTPPDLSPSGAHYGGRIEQTDAYGVLRLRPTDALATILGLRVSSWKETEWDDYSGTRSTTTLTDDSSVLTPYAGLVLDIGERLSAYASYTDIFEPQGAEDVNGKRLDPLVGRSYEVGLKGEFNDGKLNTTLAVFRVEQDNMAVAIPNAPPNPNGNTPYRAEDGTTSRGVELEAVGELTPGWQLGGGYAYAKPQDADHQPLLTEVPEQTLKVFSTYELPGLLQGVKVGANVRWQDKVYLEDSGPNGETFRQGDQWLVDLMASCDLTKQLSVSVHLNNLFDSTYYSGVTWGHGIYETPRNFLLGLRWKM